MNTFIMKTSLLSVAAAAFLSVGVPAVASARDFVSPTGNAATVQDGSSYTALSEGRSVSAGQNTVNQIENGYGSGLGSGPFGGNPNGN